MYYKAGDGFEENLQAEQSAPERQGRRESLNSKYLQALWATIFEQISIRRSHGQASSRKKRELQKENGDQAEEES